MNLSIFKNLNQLLLLFSILISVELPAQTQFTIDLNEKGVDISPTHYGVFFEDINHAADGGMYAELIRNRSFEDATTIDPWAKTGTAAFTLSLDNTNALNSNQTNSLKMMVTSASASARAGVYNPGYWGINVVLGRQYTLTFFAKRNITFAGNITASLESSTGTKYATAVVSGLTTNWQKFTCTLTATGNNPSGRLVLSANSVGTIWFDVVSLFPPTFNNRPNGLRPDLAQMVADLHPKFIRFPGGCFVEGDYLNNRFQWKKTIGKIEERSGHNNLWGYRTSDGMGFHEYLQFAEDISAKPLYVCNIGVAHSDFQPYTDLGGYIQDALDALEYANGVVTTTFGAMRAANGHPEPFNINYVEIGNENSWGDNYSNRFTLFYNAIKAKYPTMQCIADGSVTTTEYVDEHYYSSPQWFIDQYKKYDTYSRTGSKVYVGEYAVTSGCGLGNLAAAIGEAVYMCGMEKNSDIVPMNSYAPMFVNVNDRKWNPDLIAFNAYNVYCTPSYYVQKMFANNIGTVNLQIEDSLNRKSAPINGAVGIGTWATQADYDDVKVEKADGTVLINDSLNNTSAWTPYIGAWSNANGIYSQTSLETDCRSITKSISDTAYTYSLRARKKSGNEGFLVIFGYKDQDNFYWWNLGGWGNTKHGIERSVSGTKKILGQVPGSIQTNVWYSIKIKVTASKVYCYLNDKLIQSFDVQEENLLYSSASLDENEGLIYLKIVNPSTSDIKTTLNFKGLNTNEVNGEQIVLSSDSQLDENSLAAPDKVYPVTTSIDAYPTEFQQTITTNSVNIFKIKYSATSKVSEYHLDNFRISPNPTTDHILIHYKDRSKCNVQVLNLSGSLLIDKLVEDGSTVDLSLLPPGVYIIHVDGLGSRKIIKY